MSRQICILFLVSFIFIVLPMSALATVEEKTSQSFALDQNGKIKVQNISGDISVKTWDKDEVQVEAIKVGRSEEELSRVTVDISSKSDYLRIEVDHKKGRHGTSVSVSFNLVVPESAKVDIKTVSGDVRAEGLKGEFEAQSVSGDVEIENMGNNVQCVSVSGKILALHVTGEAELQTVSGKIEATTIVGSIEAETVSGDIILENVSDAREIEANSVSGDLHYDGELKGEGRYTLKSHSGDVILKLPESSSFQLEAKTFSGKIRSDFEMTIKDYVNTRKIQGTVGDGGAELELGTFSGNIIVKK